jgi:hypothetical protein
VSRYGWLRAAIPPAALLIAACASSRSTVVKQEAPPSLAAPAATTASVAAIEKAEEEANEATPAMAKKLAAYERYAAPDSREEASRASWAEQEWLAHSIPGTDIPSVALETSREHWRGVRGRGAAALNEWEPLGPTWARSLPNPFRDRAVYNGGTPDFSGRITQVAIDPNCGNRGRYGRDHDDRDDDHDSDHRGEGRGDDDDRGDESPCRVWIAVGGGGGVWRTDNALARHPDWEYVSASFEHNSMGAIELDPNDRDADTLWVGTGEANACGSGCETGVGLYKSTDGGEHWQGPYGRDAFYDRAIGSIEVKPGDPSVIFAGSGRGIRGLTSSCCGGADALVPGAPHFGLWRSKDGGRSWQLVHQGATALCTLTATPDQVALNQTACSPRGARRVVIDPVDPNTVYVSFFSRGIWRSRSNGDPGTWEQIMAPISNPTLNNAERAELDVVRLPSGESRMFVGVGGGDQYARLRRNDNVRSAPAGAVLASWIDLTSAVPDTPGYSSFGYCDPQCHYDNYVYAPAAHSAHSGADADTVYLSGSTQYNENNWGPLSPRAGAGNPALGRSSGRGVALSTNAGVSFTDMTDDTTDDFYPVEIHPDNQALVVNPRNWKQFFSVGDGGIVRSNGFFADDSGDCIQPKGYTGTALTFCQLVLSRVPERLETINKGLRTLHFYQLDVSPFDPTTVIAGAQDNGSWERGDTKDAGTNSSEFPPDFAFGHFPTAAECLGRGHGGGGFGRSGSRNGRGGEDIWVNVNISDGGHTAFDKGDPCFRLTGWFSGQMMVHYEPKNQLDANWIADTQFVLYGNEANAFVGVANDDPVHEHWLWSARQHVFRSQNQGRNPIMTKELHRQHCNVWYGDADVDDNGVYEPAKDICDDWKPLGDPGPNGRLTSSVTYGATKAGGYVSVVERAQDGGTVWAATQVGRVLVSKNADNPVPTAVVFDRIDNDPTAVDKSPSRFVSAIYVDPKDANHAWVVYSGFNAKDPATPGHIFEVRYAPNASTFKLLDGNEPRDRLGDIPATSVAVAPSGRIYVGTDYGCVASTGDGVWRPCGRGLPHMPVADLMYVREQRKIYAATQGQGVWALRVDDIEHDDDDHHGHDDRGGH